MDTKALRQKILDLAIRGKLVPQNPDDEPASVLLERIREQKQQMLKEGKLKKKDIKNDTIIFKGEDNFYYEQFQDGTVKCIQDEIPFDVPEGWEWSRLESICSVLTDGTHKTPTYSDTGFIFLSSKNVTSGKIDWHNVMNIPESLHQELYKRIAPQLGDILLAKNGTTGVAAIVDRAEIFDIYVSLALIRITENIIIPEYILNVIGSSYIQGYFLSSLKGIGVPNLHLEHIRKTLLPIPPYYEQQRICSYLENLLSIVEQIKTDQENLQNLIIKSKSKILNLAIRGKLVPQDPNDEPASVLLKHIQGEKEKLIKQGKIKRDKKESVIFKADDNSYYQDLPKNWETCSIMAIAEVDLGKTLDKNKNKGKFYPYLRSINIKWNALDLSDIKEMRFEADELDRYRIVKNDLLICEGGDAGRCCIWDSHKSIFYQNALHRVRFYGDCEPKYFLYFMMHLEQIGYLKRISNGVTIKHLTKNALSTIPFMLPPLAEQKRIVEIIEKIFTKLDEIAN